MVTDARQAILGRLQPTRRADPRVDHLADQAGAPERSAPLPVRRFVWSAAERLTRFTERLTAVRGEVQAVGDDWPHRLYEILRARRVGELWYGPGGPHGAALERGWPDPEAVRLRPYREPVEQCRAALFNPDAAGFTACRGVVAETGSLVLWPGPDEPRLLSLVPSIHVVLLAADVIHSTFAELLEAQEWARGLPTNALLISGPSKSADIEQTLSYGVHGPRELIVLLR